MTTAPDLPLPAAAAPTVAPAQRASLALVPAPVDVGQIVDFDEALRHAGPRLQRYAVRRLLDPHEAEEVVQEALLRAFQHRDALRTEDDLMAWLTVVTGRLVIDRLRVRGRSTPVAELPPGGRTARDTAELVVARDEARTALDALEAMPTRQAAVLWAREVEGLSYDDIGDRFGLSEPTVRSLLHRARKTLRREYETRGGTLPTLGLVAFAPWLRGLRIAGKLRHVVKRTTGAAALTATTIAVVTTAPLWSHPAPSRVAAAPPHHLVVKADNRATDDVSRHLVHAATAPMTTSTAVAPTQRQAHPFDRLPTACTWAGVGAGCTRTQPANTLFVDTPLRQVGVSTDEVPVDCTGLPATTLTHCQPSDRKN
jgi:RNA polymerase sigma-70 factor (ECF subfamily)